MASSERESVKVVVRCRPFSEKEKNEGHFNIITMDKRTATVCIQDPRVLGTDGTQNKGAIEPPKSFTFDSVFDSGCEQLEVYNTTARPIVESVLSGYNGTIFAYGQTGTGKTFSMEGVRDNPKLRGIIPNSFEHIFSHIKTSPTNTQYLVRASYLEIYNEEIRDLLNPKAGKLEVKERADIGVYVKDLRTFVVKDVEEMDRLMSFGNKNRSVGATQMNERSSRSHSIFTITVETSEVGTEKEDHIKAGKLHLVDLAGSERQTKTGATGDRLKEATKINLSLSALGNVISALVDGKSSHIPYRDSKLTRLLQDSLGGNARTLMLATLSPASYNYDESLSTLRYANRAKNIKNKPKVNEDPKDAMLREFQEEIKRLKAQLEATENGEMGDPVIQEIEEIEEVEEIEEIEEDELEVGAEGAAEQARPGKIKPSKPKKERKARTHREGPVLASEMLALAETESQPTAEVVERGEPAVGIAARPHMAISETQLQEMQAMVEAEKQSILKSKDLEEAERNRLLDEAEKRAQELETERNQRSQLSAKLAQLEQKLLVGGVNIIDKNEEQKQLLAKQASELEEQARKERELQRELEEHEETNLQIEEEYASLQEEAAAKTRKLKKLWALIQSDKSEIKDLQEEHQRTRESLLETIRDLTRELKLQMLIINSFVPDDEQNLIEECAEYDESADKWRIAHIAHAGNNIRGKRSLVSGQLLGFHREGHADALDNTDMEPWDPLCVFPDVYLSYDVPTVPSPKKRTERKKNSASQGNRRPVRSGSEAAKRSPTKSSSTISSGSGLRSSSTLTADTAGSAVSNPDSSNSTPAARGLVSKTKHYA